MDSIAFWIELGIMIAFAIGISYYYGKKWEKERRKASH